MKLMIALSCMFFTFFINEAHADKVLKNSATHWYTCATYEESGLQCWGNEGIRKLRVLDKNGETIPYQGKDYKEISAGSEHLCALVNNQAVCWTKDGDPVRYAPELKNPRQLASGFGFSCALDDTGVKCWGSNDYGQLQVPNLKKPRYISAGAKQACALDETGVKCWGAKCEFNSCVPMPKFKYPTMISSNYYMNCVIDENKVKCWGTNENKQLQIPNLQNPKFVTVGHGTACAIDDYGLKCWGDFLLIPNVTPFPHVPDAKSVTMGLKHFCVLKLDDTQECWGDNDKEQLFTPERAKIIEDLRREAELEKIKRTKPAQLIPAGSQLLFTKEILIEMNKSSVLIGKEKDNLMQCLLIVTPDPEKERRIRADKIYMIKDVESLENGSSIETSFKLDGAPASISCFADYPNLLTIGEVTDSLSEFGIKLTTLKLPEPTEFED